MVKQYKVLISTNAQDSLDQIVEYVTEASSYDAALHLERKLLEAIQSLKTFPNGYGRLKVERKKSANPYRFLPKENYKIIYTVEEEPTAIVIVIMLIHDSRATATVEDLLP